MVASMKMPTFKGIGNEDIVKFWFFTDAIWRAQHVNIDNVKKVQLATPFKYHALDWYIKYVQENPNDTIDELKYSLKEQFKKPKSYLHLVTELKEIHEEINESVWEADQIVKCNIIDGGSTINDA